MKIIQVNFGQFELMLDKLIGDTLYYQNRGIIYSMHYKYDELIGYNLIGVFND
jgi:hypothetical protein